MMSLFYVKLISCSRFCRALLLFAPLMCTGVAYSNSSQDITSAYEFADTRKLVELVERAAALVEAKGDEAFKKLQAPSSEWLREETYFYAFTPDGTCVFHAESPHLIGRNLIDLKDMHGKLITRDLVEIATNPDRNGRGWIFFEWGLGAQLTSNWKGAYARKVTTPDGKIYIIGSGAYDLKMERIFVHDKVDEAILYLQKNGAESAFAAYKNPATPFSFLGSYIFVLDQDGKTLVDPAFPNDPGRNIRNFRDAAGLQPIDQLLAQLNQKDSASVQYLWRRPGEAMPSRKVIYARRVVVDGQTMIVGADYFRATPVWMRD